MIDVNTDRLIEIKDVPKRLRCSLQSVMRWIINGVRGCHEGRVVKLEAVRMGRTWYTTDAALQQFAEALTQSNLSAFKSEGKRPVKDNPRRRKVLANLKARGMAVRE